MSWQSDSLEENIKTVVGFTLIMMWATGIFGLIVLCFWLAKTLLGLLGIL